MTVFETFCFAICMLWVQGDEPHGGCAIKHGRTASELAATEGKDLVIQAGEEVILDGGEYGTIVVYGELGFGAGPVKVICDDLIVAEGGYLNMGTRERPRSASLTVLIGATPLDADDTEQMGRGVRVAGKWTAASRPCTSWTTAEVIHRGSTSLTLRDVEGWRAGDRLVIPCLKPIDEFGYGNPLQQTLEEANATDIEYHIASISGLTVTLDRPITYDVLPVYCGEERVQEPIVANLSRDICIRSEDPEVVRGHVMVMHSGESDLYGVEFRDLGRSQAIPGSQIGRYGGLHCHWCVKPQRTENCTADGSGVAKWLFIHHRTHFSLFRDCIGYNAAGACFVNEDGIEVGDEWHRCLAIRCSTGPSASANIQANMNEEGLRDRLDLRGAEGAGFWQATDTHVHECISLGCVFGFQVVGDQWARAGMREGHAPRRAGEPWTDIVDLVYGTIAGSPMEMKHHHNRAFACSFGIEIWDLGAAQHQPVVLRDCLWGYCFHQFRQPGGTLSEAVLIRCRMFHRNGFAHPYPEASKKQHYSWVVGARSDSAYAVRLEFHDCAVVGCDAAVGSARTLVFQGLDIRGCRKGVWLDKRGNPELEPPLALVEIMEPAEVTFTDVSEFKWYVRPSPKYQQTGSVAHLLKTK